MLIDQDEPTTYQVVVTSLNFVKWLEAMRFELESMYINQLSTLVGPRKSNNSRKQFSLFQLN